MDMNKINDGDFERVEKEIVLSEEERKLLREERKGQFLSLDIPQLLDILGLTIKEDDMNKIIVFLACLSAFTEDSQLNISFNAPSSSGKSYIPLEIVSLFPKDGVIKVGYCSPTAFFHDRGNFNKELSGYFIDLERKIMIFLDQPHNLLLEHLRPFLSHDEKEIQVKITDKSQKHGLRTKNVILRGYPSVIFCSAGLKIDEQEQTRFILLSPETSAEKIRQGVREALRKEVDREAYYAELNAEPRRQHLAERIRAIKEERILSIRIHDPGRLERLFFEQHTNLQPRHQRDIKRLCSFIKCIALLNLWHRETDKLDEIITTDEDFEAGFRIWRAIAASQDLHLPPYVHKILLEVILPLHEEKKEGLTRKEILCGHWAVYGRPLEEHKLRKDIIPMLEAAGLVAQEPDPDDKRVMLLVPIDPTTVSTVSEAENGVDGTVG